MSKTYKNTFTIETGSKFIPQELCDIFNSFSVSYFEDENFDLNSNTAGRPQRVIFCKIKTKIKYSKKLI